MCPACVIHSSKPCMSSLQPSRNPSRTNQRKRRKTRRRRKKKSTKRKRKWRRIRKAKPRNFLPKKPRKTIAATATQGLCPQIPCGNPTYPSCRVAASALLPRIELLVLAGFVRWDGGLGGRWQESHAHGKDRPQQPISSEDQPGRNVEAPKSPMKEQIPSFPGDQFLIASALSFVARRSQRP